MRLLKVCPLDKYDVQRNRERPIKIDIEFKHPSNHQSTLLFLFTYMHTNILTVEERDSGFWEFFFLVLLKSKQDCLEFEQGNII